MPSPCRLSLLLSVLGILLGSHSPLALAQTTPSIPNNLPPDLPSNLPNNPIPIPIVPLDEPPSDQPLPETAPREPGPTPDLPPAQELLDSPDGGPDTADIPDRIFVERFEVIGSTVFSPEELAAATAPFTGREVTFAELLQARSAIDQLYSEKDYVTSGAFIPEQTLEDNVVIIQVLEGSLSEIRVNVNGRLRERYVRRRLELAGQTPLNVGDLLEGLQLLQL
ncbi:MAG: POTRA domain-containing protein, partial [Leptolyngbyaceae bacterium]|nr:POTRA domain-containing protein [Leptolyngbyaceae bacterium]